MPLTEQIRELNTELGLFEWRRRTLPADLVLMGLATDVLETGAAIQETAESALPHKAFANARLAFEAGQQMLVLATHDNYEGAGTDAWVYFELKAAAWHADAVRLRDPATPVSTRQLLKARVAQMREAWSLYREDAGAMLDRSVESVWDWHDRRQFPDNWLRQHMTQRHNRAYELFAADTGGGFRRIRRRRMMRCTRSSVMRHTQTLVWGSSRCMSKDTTRELFVRCVRPNRRGGPLRERRSLR